ncbi:MAG: hypothetical protein AAGC93_21465 [Cyanobacteria bacterium P01_F01_bin.53]
MCVIKQQGSSSDWLSFMCSHGAATIFALGTTFGIGVTQGVRAVSFSLMSYPTGKVLTLSDYERLKPKMTLTDVRAILGNGMEVSQSVTGLGADAIFTTKHEWRNTDGSKIAATFHNNILIKKDLLSR